MKDIKEYLRDARIPMADLETVLKRLQEDAFAEGYRAAGDQMIAIAERREGNIKRIADHARRVA